MVKKPFVAIPGLKYYQVSISFAFAFANYFFFGGGGGGEIAIWLRAAGVRFVYHEYDYRPNRTTGSPLTN